MNKLLILLVTFFLTAQASNATHVMGYYRSNGTYVQPHYRSNPNSSRSDNYSTKGNYNPYTGKKGTVDPYKQYPKKKY